MVCVARTMGAPSTQIAQRLAVANDHRHPDRGCGDRHHFVCRWPSRCKPAGQEAIGASAVFGWEWLLVSHGDAEGVREENRRDG
jgi:hypothetical protein